MQEIRPRERERERERENKNQRNGGSSAARRRRCRRRRRRHRRGLPLDAAAAASYKSRRRDRRRVQSRPRTAVERSAPPLRKNQTSVRRENPIPTRSVGVVSRFHPTFRSPFSHLLISFFLLSRLPFVSCFVRVRARSLGRSNKVRHRIIFLHLVPPFSLRLQKRKELLSITSPLKLGRNPVKRYENPNFPFDWRLCRTNIATLSS